MVALVACHGHPRRPHVPAAASVTIELAGSIRAVAADQNGLYAAVATSAGTTVTAFRGTQPAWTLATAGTANALTRAGALVVVAASASGSVEQTTLRGDPAAIVTAIDGGKARWTLAFDSTEWALVTSLAPIGDDVLVGGSFAGTLRVATNVVSSAGSSDGFVARVTLTGQLAWLVRIGGAGADGVQGVAARGEQVAIAGTFTPGAELLGQVLEPYDERLPFGDGFVAGLDGKGARRWAQTFGGRGDDTVAGVAIDDAGNVIVAASVHDAVRIGNSELVSQGDSDGLVVWFSAGGAKGPAVLLGGLDYDGLRAITAAADQVVVGGFFSGSIRLAGRTLVAGGSDDAFVAALDPDGTVASTWHVGGPGREEIAALAVVSGGFVAGVQHTAAATIEGTKLAGPRDPMTGSALIVRGLP